MKDISNGTGSIAQQVRELIQNRPSIVECLKLKIINYSALARILQEEIGNGSIEAVKVAIIRVSDELVVERNLRENPVIGIIKNSKIQLRDKIGVIISRTKLNIPHIVSANLTNEYIYIVDQTRIEDPVPEYFNYTKNLVAIMFISPMEVKTTPGYIAYINQLLASENINIVEFISSASNTIIVLDGNQALHAYGLLQKHPKIG